MVHKALEISHRCTGRGGTGGTCPPAVGLEILSGLKSPEKKRRNEEKERKEERKKNSKEKRKRKSTRTNKKRKKKMKTNENISDNVKMGLTDQQTDRD